MQIFESSNKKHDFDYNIKLWGTTGTLTYQFFLKSIDLKVPNLIAPLSLIFNDSLSKQGADWMRSVVPAAGIKSREK